MVTTPAALLVVSLQTMWIHMSSCQFQKTTEVGSLEGEEGLKLGSTSGKGMGKKIEVHGIAKNAQIYWHKKTIRINLKKGRKKKR